MVKKAEGVSIKKIGGYLIISFFALIIVLSFGIGNTFSNIQLDQDTVASVNGKKISIMEYRRKLKQFSQYRKTKVDERMQEMVLTRMIYKELQVQLAEDYGVEVSDEKVLREIKKAFSDENGVYKPEYLKRVLDHYMMSEKILFNEFKRDLIVAELARLFSSGLGVSPEEVHFEYMVSESAIQIKYAFLSNKEIKERFADRLKVSDQDIEKELKDNPDEVKDPKTDKERIRKKLTKDKLDAIKKELVTSINKLADKGASFEKAATLLKGKVGISNEFKIGATVREKGKKGRSLFVFSQSEIFRNECLALGKGHTSQVIEYQDGLYIFTPFKTNIVKKKDVPEKDETRIASMIKSNKWGRAAYYYGISVPWAVFNPYYEKSRIIRNLKLKK
jgi:hypothetical protein